MTKLRRDGSESDADHLQDGGSRITIKFDFDHNEKSKQEYTGKKKTRWYATELATMFEDRIEARENFTPSGALTLEALATYKKPGIPASDLSAIENVFDNIIGRIAAGDTKRIATLSLPHGHLSFQATYEPRQAKVDKFKEVPYDDDADRAAGRERHEPLMSPLPQQESPMGTQIERSQVLSVVLKDASSVLSKLAALDDELTEVQKPVVKKTQEYLESLEGYSFASLEANQEVATQIQLLLNRLGKRIRCPRDGCDQPAILECRPAGGTINGSFKYRHVIEGVHTNHGGSIRLPKMSLVPAPPSLRRGRKKSN